MRTRANIFETNSSSSHSISFNPWKSGKDGNNFVPDENGVIHISGEDFGWGWASYNDSATKASYYLVRYKDMSDRIDLLKEVIKGYTGAEVIIDSTEGYIDHQSSDILDLPEADPEALKDWLFNPDNWLYIGNDNEDEPEGFRDQEWKNLEGNHVVVTLDFGPDDNDIEIKLIGMPNEENLGQKLEEISLSDGYYDLVEMDLEENRIVLHETWNGGQEKIGKIVKIKSDEFGEIIP